MEKQDNQNKKTKVLIAEDDLFISEVYSAKLSSEGYEVILAGDGEEALEKFQEHKPGVVLLDILMPKVDGWEVLGEIRKDEQNKDAIIIMLTNVGDKESIDKAVKSGANDYFIKSFFTPEEVIVKIEKYIG